MATSPFDSLCVTRQLLGPYLAAAPLELVDRIPPGCKNNQRWLLGHVIGSTERLCLGLTGLGEPGLPAGWLDWFGNGKSPADFTAATPDWAALQAELPASTARLEAALAGQDLSIALPEPWAPRGLVFASTRAEAVAFALWHEGLHHGQMMTYGNLLKLPT